MWWEVLLVSIGSVVGVIAGHYTKILEAWVKARNSIRKVDGAEREIIIVNLENHINRLERKVDEQQLTLNFLQQEYTATVIELSEMYGWLLRIHDSAKRMSETVKFLGGIAEPIPDLPQRRVRREIDPGFLRRTEQQNEELVRLANQKLAKIARMQLEKEKSNDNTSG